jgi:hypothetical protein
MKIKFTFSFLGFVIAKEEKLTGKHLPFRPNTLPKGSS